MAENRILVTGGSGYFGGLLTQKLVQRGQPCRVFDLNDASDRPASVEFVRGDIRHYAAIRQACEGISIVHHNVAQVPLAKDQDLFESVNITGTELLLKAAQDARVRKVVYTSSSAVFGVPDRNPVTELTSLSPGEAYGEAKAEGERICGGYVKAGMDVSIVRPRTILGHGRLGIFQILFEWIFAGANVPVLGSGDNRYQFVHADDLADACILAGERPGPETYNCGAERFGSMRAALETLCRHAGTGSQVTSVPMAPAVWAMQLSSALGLSPLGPYHALMYGRSMYFDIGKAKSQLGWQPKYSNDEMLAQSYDWYCAHRDDVLAATTGSHHRRGVRQGILRLARVFL